MATTPRQPEPRRPRVVSGTSPVDGCTGAVHAAARVLVDYSDWGWVRMLAEQVAGPSGHCRACSSSAVGAPVWPCSLWSIAGHAEQLPDQPTADSACPSSHPGHRPRTTGRPLLCLGDLSHGR